MVIDNGKGRMGSFNGVMEYFYHSRDDGGGGGGGGGVSQDRHHHHHHHWIAGEEVRSKVGSSESLIISDPRQEKREREKRRMIRYL